MSPKPLVFISHIGEERDIAASFKKLVESEFLGLFEVFVSSDSATIGMGEQWLRSISRALEQCAIEIIVASPSSVSRPWINFEAGAGWVRSIPVVPLCHSGALPATLPIPLNMLQGALATDAGDLQRVFRTLATVLNANSPNADFASFIREVRAFEEKNLRWGRIDEALQKIFDVSPELLAGLTTKHEMQANLSELQINALEPAFRWLGAEEILHAQFRIAAFFDGRGATHRCRFFPGRKLAEILNDPRYKRPGHA